MQVPVLPHNRAAFSFRPMVAEDFPLLHRWRSSAWVQTWWHPPGTLEEFSRRYAPRLLPGSPVQCFIACRHGVPIGFVQHYRATEAGEAWWADITDPGRIGIDYFLREGLPQRQGIGSAMLRALAEHLFEDPQVSSLHTDPAPANTAALATLRTVGFVDEGLITTPDGPARLHVLTRAALTPWPAWRVQAVHSAPGHAFSKHRQAEVELLAGLGVKGDAHAGVTVKHRSRVRADPSQPNLRQVHFLQGELLQALGVPTGTLGENITTNGLDLLALPRGAVLRLGAHARVQLTGLRNPCNQIEAYRAGLLSQVLEKRADGSLLRKAGVMSVVLEGGTVRPGDTVEIDWPEGPHEALQPV